VTTPRRKPLQFSLRSLFGLTTRVAVATALVKTFGGVALIAFFAFVAIIPELFFTWVLLSALIGVLVAPYAVWLGLHRLADGFRALRELVNR
jgi:hypothetical protein